MIATMKYYVNGASAPQSYTRGCVGADGRPPLRNSGRFRSVEVTWVGKITRHLRPGKSPPINSPGRTAGTFGRPPLPGINRTSPTREQPRCRSGRVVEVRPLTTGLALMESVLRLINGLGSALRSGRLIGLGKWVNVNKT